MSLIENFYRSQDQQTHDPTLPQQISYNSFYYYSGHHCLVTSNSATKIAHHRNEQSHSEQKPRTIPLTAATPQILPIKIQELRLKPQLTFTRAPRRLTHGFKTFTLPIDGSTNACPRIILYTHKCTRYHINTTYPRQ